MSGMKTSIENSMPVMHFSQASFIIKKDDFTLLEHNVLVIIWLLPFTQKRDKYVIWAINKSCTTCRKPHNW